jgi:hypothetical protein
MSSGFYRTRLNGWRAIPRDCEHAKPCCLDEADTIVSGVCSGANNRVERISR